MSLSTSLVAGLSSGFDWRSMIDQLIAIEHKRVDLVEDQKSEYESKLEIFQTINANLLSFKAKAETLANSDTFNVFKSSLSTNSSIYNASNFLAVSTTASAAPGSHTVTMNANSTVAQDRKLSSKSFATYGTALGLSGEFVINGRAVDVEIGDDLNDIKNKIDNLNSGANATGVTASIMTVSSSNYRLILTSDNTGEDAFTLFDASADSSNILSSGLGFTDGTTYVKNLLSNGAQSEVFSSSTQSVSSMLGITNAQSGTVTIGASADPNQFTVAIDLSDSLTDIAGDINTAASAAGSNATASVVSTTQDGTTTYKLKIENTTNFTDANNVLEALGIFEGDHGNVAEIHMSDTANTKTTAQGGGDIDASTKWEHIDTGSGINNVINNDTITFTGVNHIGTIISGSYTISDKSSDTVQGLLTAVQDAFAAVDSGSYTVTTVIEDGKVKITDSTSGDSRLNLSLTANNEGGGTLSLGTIVSFQEGYTMQLQAGQNANVIIDGIAITSSTNVIDDVISGVAINLLTVEPGSTVNLTISRNYDTIKSSVQDLLNAYNDVLAIIDEQFYYDDETESAGLLQGDGTIQSIKSALVDILTSTITGLPSTLNALSLIGINSKIDYTDHKNDGSLYIDTDEFTAAMKDDFNGFKRIFVAEGSTTDGDVEYINHTNDTVAGEYTVNITQAATQAGASGSVDLTGGIGATDLETLAITQGSKIAAVTFNGASGENGSSIDNIVNAINSELDEEYAQSIMGNVKNTTDAAQTTAIANTTTWDAIYSNGAAAGLEDNDVISFTGTRSNGTQVSGSYTIADADVDTVQGLISAIESAYNNEVSAAINTYGYLVITNNSTGNSNLGMILTEPSGKNLDFGDVTTSNLVGSVRNTNTDTGNAITENDIWSKIDGHSLSGGETVKFSGYSVDGTAVEGSYTVNLGEQISVFLSAIETAYGGDVDAGMQDGRLVIIEGTTNSTLGIEIFEPSGSGVDFGTLGGGIAGRYSVDITASINGSNQLVLTNDDYGSDSTFLISQSGTDLGLGSVTAGIDVAGSINGESATGSGQSLTGDAPDSEETTSVQGLLIKYTGTDTGDQGTVKITMGVGELFERVLYDITNISDGYLDYKIESMDSRINDFDQNIEDMETRLNRKMENMINKFVFMEVALSRIQSQSQWIAGQLDAASDGWGW